MQYSTGQVQWSGVQYSTIHYSMVQLSFIVARHARGSDDMASDIPAGQPGMESKQRLAPVGAGPSGGWRRPSVAKAARGPPDQ